MAGTMTSRRMTSFRFPPHLIATLKERAKEDNLSLNSYVEGILTEAVVERPNPITLAAIKEARENENLEPIDVDDFEEYVKSL